MKVKWLKFLSREIALEYKTGIYCLYLYFFYACRQLLREGGNLSILTLFQMAFVAYFVTLLQFYLFENFDEADQLRGRKFLGLLVCSLLYMGMASWFNWFGHSWPILLAFLGFMILAYLVTFFFNRLKRRIDSKHLNQLLQEYKERR